MNFWEKIRAWFARDKKPPVAPQSAQRSDLLFGYYGDGDRHIAATQDHVNLAWISGWGSSPDSAALHLAEAVLANLQVVLCVEMAYGPEPEKSVREFLGGLKARGLLSNIMSLYPIDEPEKIKLTGAQVRETNAMLRRVMAEFPELSSTKLACTYLPDDWRESEQRPGIDSYDIVGFDHYTENIFENGEYDRFKALLRPDQRIFIFAGGSSPWKQNPQPFLDRANSDPQVAGIIAFIWDWPAYENKPGDGISRNGMADVYKSVGLKIK